jgi:hypothetical protein
MNFARWQRHALAERRSRDRSPMQRRDGRGPLRLPSLTAPRGRAGGSADVRFLVGSGERRIHVPLFAEARSIASNSVSLKRQPSASRLVLA